jgi:hypothetical protein
MIIFKRVFDDGSISNNMERRKLDGDFITKMRSGEENHKISDPCAMLEIAILFFFFETLKLLFLKSTQRP